MTFTTSRATQHPEFYTSSTHATSTNAIKWEKKEKSSTVMVGSRYMSIRYYVD
jgi:hypothetical protein